MSTAVDFVSPFTSRTGLSAGGYVGILISIYFFTPIMIYLGRRGMFNSCSNRFERWVHKHSTKLDKLKSLISASSANTTSGLSSHSGKRKPLNQQLEHFLYVQTQYGFTIDCLQALLSCVSIGLVLYSSTYPFTTPDPPWAVSIEIILTIYFLFDYLLRLFLATDRMAFYFSYLSVLDFITIIPGLLTICIAETAFAPEAFIVSQTLRVFRIFRAVRLLGLVILSSSTSLIKQGIVLGVMLIAIIFASSAIFQILDSTPGDDGFVVFHKAFLYMTMTVLGRPPIPSHTMPAQIFLTFVIFAGSFLLPAFVAEMARIYFEQQGMEVYTPTLATGQHVIVCGAINTSRLKAFLLQFFHKSRDPDLLCPVVVLCEQKYEGSLKVMIEQTKYAGNVRYIRGSARKPADLQRAALKSASTVVVLCHRTADVDGAKADSEVVSSALAIKSINRKVRLLSQIRRPRTRDHLMCLPGWRDSDRAVAVSSLSMTLVGVGALIPGLPTLLTNLIHQGNKLNARSSNPRRRKLMKAVGKRISFLKSGQTESAGMIVSTSAPWWAAPLSGMLEAVESAGNSLLSLAQGGRGALAAAIDDTEAGGVGAEEIIERLLKPMSPLEEYTSGFAQEMFAFLVTPGLCGRTFATAARFAYLRFGILLVGARVPTSANAKAAQRGKASSEDPEGEFEVHLYPGALMLTTGMYLQAIAFDTLDLAALLYATGGGDVGEGGASAAKELRRAPSEGHFSPTSVGSIPSSVAVNGANAGAARQSTDIGNIRKKVHNSAAVHDIAIPWCFSEHEEERAAAVANAVEAAGERIRAADIASGGTFKVSEHTSPSRPAALRHKHMHNPLQVWKCACSENESWAKGLRRAAAEVAAASTAANNASESAESATLTTAGSLLMSPGLMTPSRVRRSRPRGYSEQDGDDGFGLDIGLDIDEKPNKKHSLSTIKRSNARPTSKPGSVAGGGSVTGSTLHVGGISTKLDEDEDDEDEDDDDATPYESGEEGGNVDAVSGESNVDVDGYDLFAFDAATAGAVDMDSSRLRADTIDTSSRTRKGSFIASSSTATILRKNSLRIKQRVVSSNPALDQYRQLVLSVRSVVAPAFAIVKEQIPWPISQANNSNNGGLSNFKDHVLLCGMSDSIGLLMRSLQAGQAVGFGPSSLHPHGSLSALIALATSAMVSPSGSQGTRLGGAAAAVAALHPHALGSGGSSALTLSAMNAGNGQDNALAALGATPKPLQVVALCPVSERLNDNAVNSMYPGSSRLMSKLTWVNGSPSDLGDLLRAGVETARCAIVLSSQKLQANPDGTDNLADDAEAIVIASAIYKLNPRLHIMTEIVHGPHASYLRPCGTSLADAEDSASAFVASVRQAAAKRAWTEQRDAIRSKKLAAAAHKKADSTLPSTTNAQTGSKAVAIISSKGASASVTSVISGSTIAIQPQQVTISVPVMDKEPSQAAGLDDSGIFESPLPTSNPASPLKAEAGTGGQAEIGSSGGEASDGNNNANNGGDTIGEDSIAGRLARDRIRLALSDPNDSIGRTIAMPSKTTQRPGLAGLFAQEVMASAKKESNGVDSESDNTPKETPKSHSDGASEAVTKSRAASMGERDSATSRPTAITSPILHHRDETSKSSTDPWAAAGSGLVPNSPLASSDQRPGLSIDNNNINPNSVATPLPSAFAKNVSAGLGDGAVETKGRKETKSSEDTQVSSTSSAVSTGLAAPKLGAPNTVFGAPSFASGRAFSSSTLDALLCEAHFAPHIVSFVKQLVRASRKQRLQLMPVSQAVALAMLASPMASPTPYADTNTSNSSSSSSSSSAAASAAEVDDWGLPISTSVSIDINSRVPLSTSGPERDTVTTTGITAQLLAANISPNRPSSGNTGALTLPKVTSYGELFEALLRGWNLLPLGLYRRVLPNHATGAIPEPPVVTDPVSAFISGFAAQQAFKADKSLLSYVFTNPPPDTILNSRDLVFVIRSELPSSIM